MAGILALLATASVLVNKELRYAPVHFADGRPDPRVRHPWLRPGLRSSSGPCLTAFQGADLGDTYVDFHSRVLAYDSLRRELEKGLQPLATSADPAEIRKATRARGKKIRAARAEAREGDIFTPAISDSFRRALADELDPETCEAILDDNPGEFKHRINSRYPDRLPLSSVPPNVLAALPELPDDLQYRFVGRHLVLLDGRSGLILDRIRFSILAANPKRDRDTRDSF